MSSEIAILSKANSEAGNTFVVPYYDYDSTKHIDISNNISKVGTSIIHNTGTSKYQDTYSTKDVHNIFNDNSCIATYQFEGNSNDLSNTFNCTSTNLTYSKGKFYGSRAGFFNGTSSYISVPSNVTTGLSAISFSFWIKRNAISSTQEIIFRRGSNAAIIIYFGVDNKISCSVDGNFNIYGSVISDTNWYFITITKSETIATNGVNMYVNAVLQSSINNVVASLPTFDTTMCSIGYSHLIPARYLNANIDQFRIFNRVISQSEINTLYTETLPRKTSVNAVDVFNDSSCKALYQFNGNTDDLSGAYNGTPTNITYGTGKFGQCAVFNGTSSYVDTSIGALALTDFAISTWVNTSYSGTNNLQIYEQKNTTDNATLDFVIILGKVRVKLWNGVAETSLISNSSVSVGVWNNIIIQRIGANLQIFINGILDSNLTNVYTYTIGNNISQIGRHPSGVNYFNGLMDQFRIFNRALSYKEVLDLYNEKTEYKAVITK